jgi:phosphatidylglycerol:prolipoprotein diacylglycerol transferase
MPSPADPVAFTLGPLEIRWYALFILSGILVGIWVASRMAKWRGDDPNFIADVAPIVILAAVLGARLYFVALEWSYFGDHPAKIIGLQLRGLTIHGALAGGILAFWIICRYQHRLFLHWADTLVCGIPVGQAIGRLGNWANQEAYGRPTTLPWGVEIDPIHRPPMYPDASTFHPTFLYEMICSFILAAILILVLQRYSRAPDWQNGTLLGLYLIGYGVIRWVIESLRTDSLRIGPWPAAYWLSAALIGVGGLLILYLYRIHADVRAST